MEPTLRNHCCGICAVESLLWIHPGGTQEAPRAPRRHQEVLEAKCAKTIAFVQQIERDLLFRVRETRVTLTIVCILQQLSERGDLGHTH